MAVLDATIDCFAEVLMWPCFSLHCCGIVHILHCHHIDGHRIRAVAADSTTACANNGMPFEEGSFIACIDMLCLVQSRPKSASPYPIWCQTWDGLGAVDLTLMAALTFSSVCVFVLSPLQACDMFVALLRRMHCVLILRHSSTQRSGALHGKSWSRRARRSTLRCCSSFTMQLFN